MRIAYLAYDEAFCRLKRRPVGRRYAPADTGSGTVAVTRYGKQHKHATMRQIIEAAGHRFKWDGIDGSGICTLMKDASLTNGAFYTHFAIDAGSGGGDQWHPEGTERPMLKPLIRADAEQRMGGAVQNPAGTAADSSR